MAYMSYTKDRMRSAGQSPFDRAGEIFDASVLATVRMIGKAVRSAHAQYVERRTAAALSRLDDRILQDIGVNRSEIRYIARRLAENPGRDYGKH
jgi:uncharacterized protein YjiS (DUF1127 family)